MTSASAMRIACRIALNQVAWGVFVLLRTSGANGLIQDHLILLSFENLDPCQLRKDRRHAALFFVPTFSTDTVV